MEYSWNHEYIGSLVIYVIILTVLLECKSEKRNSQCEQGQSMEQTKGLYCMYISGVARCQSQHQWSLLANEFDVLSVLHGQMSLGQLGAVNKICVFHRALKGCKKKCFENVNI